MQWNFFLFKQSEKSNLMKNVTSKMILSFWWNYKYSTITGTLKHMTFNKISLWNRIFICYFEIFLQSRIWIWWTKQFSQARSYTPSKKNVDPIFYPTKIPSMKLKDVLKLNLNLNCNWNQFSLNFSFFSTDSVKPWICNICT